jgi:DNA polymerase III delta subunit
MGTAGTLLDHGGATSELMKLYGLSDYAARKIMNSARQFPSEFFKKAMTLVLESDRQMKTSYDDPNRLLELLILQLAQEARNA